jgi:hypothetical protein
MAACIRSNIIKNNAVHDGTHQSTKLSLLSEKYTVIK